MGLGGKMKTTKFLKDGNDIKREIAALAKYLSNRGFQDTTEVLSFLNLFIVEVVALAIYNGESKNELFDKVAETLKEFYDKEAIEKVVDYVYTISRE